MVLVLTNNNVGQKFKIVRVGPEGQVEGQGVETYFWFLADVRVNNQGVTSYWFKKKVNDPEANWINLPKSFFDNGVALISHAMNLDGGRKRRNRKTKRRHIKKRRTHRRR